MTIALWAVAIPSSVFFTMMGLPKVLGQGGWAGRFATWGYPPWFVVVVGVAELAGAVMVLIPRLATLGASLLAVVMLGAAATHLLHGETARMVVSLVLFAVLTLLAFVRQGRFLARRAHLKAEERPH
jgi:putative oxidoreductase